ncbi:hypothetical protein GLOIN_2v1627328 [Rhizophagus irregularis DAOM 181602=DAOM 197198]|uniref:Uncharacterized protein n=1 Tax=Rhizophagus irregularis (strain DAOM 181602 / DAOM 197198 / MUCL 43194) TaxID=747089 RepID=A0A2P4PVJ7_RHIID|nr:hypothetical protein GLOIN_2v1627328 [Rhizophagus irregularis DAOM 181602=DAOM 197198]POG69402.1 hypothetical protein GLOIN_2v1627328 [Rhizophagus irregularis DAOM 181602=DAOM 197198]|eukprot:XP_025176268.1 hypothetical protein GLOIN_2v1627328 [Rhizophagus irregularis DAOM 181602=DAOM 197198]
MQKNYESYLMIYGKIAIKIIVLSTNKSTKQMKLIKSHPHHFQQLNHHYLLQVHSHI